MKKVMILGAAFGLALAMNSTAWADGATVYEDSCSGCHGENGKGAEGMNGVPDFTVAGGVLSKSDDELMKSVINGIEKDGAEVTMPPRAGDDELSDAQIKDAIAFIRGSFGG